MILLKHYTEANRAAWNEVMPYHQQAAKEKWDRLFAQPGYVCLKVNEIEQLRQCGLEGKSVAHLCCNNGVELFSLKNLGAGECIGFDICDAAIQEAEQRSRESGIDCRFVRTDVYEIGEEYEARFDMIYITVGCLGWMPDLKLFFARAAAMLRENGIVFIHEIHPFAELLPYGSHPDAGSLRIVEPYFKSEPYIEQGCLDYMGNVDYPSITTQYWFTHTLSEIMMALVENGIAIEKFIEYEKAISPHHYPIEAQKAALPLSYILIGRK
jgi:2-polyprenyl-3-methyl-5-hydroxy-6-metoxy-1,4-benzoquinol methylase